MGEKIDQKISSFTFQNALLLHHLQTKGKKRNRKYWCRLFSVTLNTHTPYTRAEHVKQYQNVWQY